MDVIYIEVANPDITVLSGEHLNKHGIRQFKKFNTLNHIWITAYDEKIPVKEMTTEHIHNCIACWNGVGNLEIPHDYLGGRRKWLEIFDLELINRQ